MNGTNVDLLDQLTELYADTFHAEAPSPDTDLLDGGVLDSFQFIALLVAIEQRFGASIDIDRFELDDLRSLTRIARLVAGIVPAAPAAHGHPH